MTKDLNSKKISVEDIIGKWIMPGCAILVIVLLAVLVLVMFSNSMSEWVGKLLGTNSMKTETIQLIGWAINGAFIASGLAFLSQRANAQLSATKSQADNGKKIPPKILDILYSYVPTKSVNPQEIGARMYQPEEPAENVQVLLDILFKSQDIDRSHIKPNHQGVYSLGVNLPSAYLSKADLHGADLRGANLCGAYLIKTYLRGADLSGATLTGANLTGADLSEADLSGADLSGATFFGNLLLEGASYTNKTRFPYEIVPPITPPNNGDKVQFPVHREIPKIDE